MLLALALACAPPFDETRKDLDGFRLLGMTADLGGEGALGAAVWSGDGAFHAVAPTVTWTRNGAEIDAVAGENIEVRVRVEAADGGASEEGLLAVRGAPIAPVVAGFTRTIDGDTASIALTVEGDADAYTRWMSTDGTFTETAANAADLALGDSAVTTIFALTLNGRGGNTWTWIDVATDAGPYFAVGGRLLPVDTAVPAEGAYAATITPADTHAGFVLTEFVPAESADAIELVCGLDPFDADALVDGRCGLDEAAGRRVHLTGAPWP